MVPRPKVFPALLPLLPAGRMDMLKLKTLEEVKHIMEVGDRYARQLYNSGHFEHLEVGEVALDHLEEGRRPELEAAAAGPAVPRPAMAAQAQAFGTA